MNWYHRGEERYVEYGSSFPATRAFGVVRSLYDTVYNMNLAHLTRAHRTVFEHLDDAGLRTACTTYLIYRGRTRHEPSGVSVYRRIAEAAQFRHAVWGAARALLRRPVRLAQHRLHLRRSACPASATATPAAWAPTWWRTTCSTSCSSRCPTTTLTRTSSGPDGQVDSIAEADRALERIMHVAGGPRRSSSEHAVIVMSDHSQKPIEESVNLADGARGLARAAARATRRRWRPSWRCARRRARRRSTCSSEARREELVRAGGRHAARSSRAWT